MRTCPIFIFRTFHITPPHGFAVFTFCVADLGRGLRMNLSVAALVGLAAELVDRLVKLHYPQLMSDDLPGNVFFKTIPLVLGRLNLFLE